MTTKTNSAEKNTQLKNHNSINPNNRINRKQRSYPCSVTSLIRHSARKWSLFCSSRPETRKGAKTTLVAQRASPWKFAKSH